METIPITEAKARIAELADRVAREHDHFTPWEAEIPWLFPGSASSAPGTIP
jgi:hypothetical protein